MVMILDESVEEKKLFDLMERIEKSIPMEEKHLLLITILINTTEKLEAFQKWIEENTDGDELMVTEIQIMNKVSKISRMY